MNMNPNLNILLSVIAIVLSVYNIACGMLYRLNGNENKATTCGLEAGLWFIAASICIR